MWIRNNHKYLSLMIILYILLWVLMISYTYSQIVVDHFIISISTLFIPFWFFIANIVAEVYGYEYFRHMVKYVLRIQLIIVALALIIALFMKNYSLNTDFQNWLWLIHHLPLTISANLIALSWFSIINNFIIPKLKALLDEKYFTLRSSGISLIGELGFIIAVNFISLFGVYSTPIITKIIISAILFCLIVNTCLIIPSNIMVKLLNQIEYPNQEDEDIEESIFDIIQKNSKFEKDI